MRDFVDRSRERLALIKRSDRASSGLAIFVHGFRAGYLQTWGNLPAALRERADEEEPFASWDYLFLGYETSTITSLLAIATLIAARWKEATAGSGLFDHEYEKVALFGHSLGTLGIRQLLCATCAHPSGFADAIKGVAFFGSPLNGSMLAPFAKLAALADLKHGLGAALPGLLPGGFAIKEALRPDGPQLIMLRTWNESIRDHVSLPQVDVYQAAGDLVVGPVGTYAGWKGDTVSPRTLDHKQISKIDTAAEWGNSSLWDALVKVLG